MLLFKHENNIHFVIEQLKLGIENIVQKYADKSRLFCCSISKFSFKLNYRKKTRSNKKIKEKNCRFLSIFSINDLNNLTLS